MAKYDPFQQLVYNYKETTETTSVKCLLKVELSAGETIEIQQPRSLRPDYFYLELFVISDPSKLTDYQWQGEAYIPVSIKQLYNPAIVVQLTQKKSIVRTEINNLLFLYRAQSFVVLTAVTRATPNPPGGDVSSTISGSGEIEITV
jgi:hypothetical protein